MTAPLGIPALVLAAGLGTRLRPLTDSRAKPAVPLVGSPLVARILNWLAAHGVREVVMNLHHHPASLTRIVGDGTSFDLAIRYSWERTPLGSAGGPRRALPLLGTGPFLIVNGDTLTDVDLPVLVRAHRDSGALVTMALMPNPNPARYGGVILEADGAVRRFSRPGEPAGGFQFVGVQVADPVAFQDLPVDERTESVNVVYPRLIAERPGSVRGLVFDGRFLDVGRPDDYLAACLVVAADEGRGDVWIGPDSRVDPGARLVRTMVWSEAEVGADCELVDCVVGDGVRLSPGRRFERAAIAGRTDRPLGPDEERDGDLVVRRW